MNYYDEIKNKLIDNEINRKVKNYSINKSDLDTYYNVGKMLSEAGKHYGESIIKNYSLKLVKEVDKKYNVTNLKRYRQFYYIIEKGALMGHQLSWSHYRELIPIKDINKINYYIKICTELRLTRDELKNKIKNNEYERIDENTKNKLITKDNIDIKDYVPNPILIKNKNNIEVINEKILHQLIMEDISSFMEELGTRYSFIKSEYKIKIGDRYNFIDLLLYNIKYHCYVVIEFKVTEFKVEYIGQILKYMNYIDKNIKSIEEDKTIGIIICKKNNKFYMEYCSDDRIIAREYEFV